MRYEKSRKQNPQNQWSHRMALDHLLHPQGWSQSFPLHAFFLARRGNKQAQFFRGGARKIIKKILTFPFFLLEYYS